MGAYIQTSDGALFFDLVETEQHERVFEATTHAVEEGASVTDHIRPGLDTVTLSVISTMSPIVAGFLTKRGKTPLVGANRGQQTSTNLDVKTFKPGFVPTPGGLFNAATSAIGSLISGGDPIYKADVLQFETGFNSPSETYAILRDIQDKRKPIVVVTPVWDYPDMILTRVNMKRSRDTGTGSAFDLELKRIRTVQTKIVDAPKPTVPQASPKKPKGSKAVDEVQDPKRTSLFRQIVDKYSGGGGGLGGLVKGLL
jgi:hypothetical protein